MAHPMSINSPLVLVFRDIVKTVLSSKTPHHRVTPSIKRARSLAANFSAYRGALRQACDPSHKRYRPDEFTLELIDAERIRVTISNTTVIFTDYLTLPEYVGMETILKDRRELAELADPFASHSKDSIEEVDPASEAIVDYLSKDKDAKEGPIRPTRKKEGTK